ncbi:hypothetical protein [Alkalihalophilus marmarensis]|uniref:Uncharacterized protein n=1 Tax=Alkalihalophilus marmarensis DSM 21297 TaxID=1188261 RepID=U6SJ61_9BACI|nr:hypothetical protein [Alkalihalophilus marmarensis]ERN51623.1 hypothetical protein A33I_20025 [Alkalihalophilus marmarensis DSM 21297]
MGNNDINLKKSTPSESSKSYNKNKKVYYKQTKANAEVLSIGQEIIDTMSNEEFDKLGSKSDSLHFITLLGLSSKKTTRKVRSLYMGYIEESCSTPVGVSLRSDIDIQVSLLKDVTKDKKSGINPEVDFYNHVFKAGEIINLTLYEFMFLIIREEYSGFLKVDKQDFYAHLSVKLPAYWRNDAKLPTPTIVFEKGNGSSRSSILDIDDLSGDIIKIKQEYNRLNPLLGNA